MNSLSYIFKSPIDLSDEMIPINTDLCIGKIYPSQVDEGFIHVTRKVLDFHTFRLIKRFKIVDQTSSFSRIEYIEYSMFYRINHYRLIFLSAYIPLKFIYGNGFSKIRRRMMNCRKHLINGMRRNIGSVCYLLNIQGIEK